MGLAVLAFATTAGAVDEIASVALDAPSVHQLVRQLVNETGWRVSVESVAHTESNSWPPPATYSASFATLRQPPSAEYELCAAAVLTALVHQLNTDPLARERYRLVNGTHGFTLLPQEVRRSDGRWEAAPVLSDTQIGLGTSHFESWSAFFDAWRNAFGGATSQHVSVMTTRNTFLEPVDLRLSTDRAGARDLLVEALTLSGSDYVWQLGGGSDGQTLLWVAPGCSADWNLWQCTPVGRTRENMKAGYERRRRPTLNVGFPDGVVNEENVSLLRAKDPDVTLVVTYPNGQQVTHAPPAATCPTPTVLAALRP